MLVHGGGQAVVRIQRNLRAGSRCSGAENRVKGQLFDCNIKGIGHVDDPSHPGNSWHPAGDEHPFRKTDIRNLLADRYALAVDVPGMRGEDRSTRAQLRATREIIAHNEKSVAILRDKLEHGYASAVDLATQELQLAQAKSQLPPLQKQFEQNRDLIRELVGNLPDQDVSETFELTSLHLPAELPLSLPSKIIEQRPDIRAAEESMRAANANMAGTEEAGLRGACARPAIVLRSSGTINPPRGSREDQPGRRSW